MIAKTYTLMESNSEVLRLRMGQKGQLKWNGQFQSDQTNQEKWSTSKGGPAFLKLFNLDLGSIQF